MPPPPPPAHPPPPLMNAPAFGAGSIAPTGACTEAAGVVPLAVGAGRGGALALLAVEELAVAFVAAVDGDEQDGGAVAGQQGADGVELGGEDLEHDEGEGELRECGTHIGALEGALGRADLDQPGRCLVLDEDTWT